MQGELQRVTAAYRGLLFTAVALLFFLLWQELSPRPLASATTLVLLCCLGGQHQGFTKVTWVHIIAIAGAALALGISVFSNFYVLPHRVLPFYMALMPCFLLWLSVKRPSLLLMTFSLLSYPYEKILPAMVEQHLLAVTARASYALITMLGGNVLWKENDPPILVVERVAGQIELWVTSLCGGVELAFATLGLGLVIALLWIPQGRFQLIFAVWVLPITWLLNVLRITVSTLALEWGGAQHWSLFHDLIGYGMFTLMYALFIGYAYYLGTHGMGRK